MFYQKIQKRCVHLKSLAPSENLSVSSNRKLNTLVDLLFTSFFKHDQKGFCILSGAGLSTSSGIPDYRGPFGSYKRGHQPMTHHEFISNSKKRARYWSRSFVGYNFFGAAQPNDGHIALSEMNKLILPKTNLPLVSGQITQNVDGLLYHNYDNKKSSKIIELHGNIHYATCQSCENTRNREDLQNDMIINNPYFNEIIEKKITSKNEDDRLTADGDFDLTEFERESEGNNKYIPIEETFITPKCNTPKCDGILKPSVVFFGGSVDQKIVDECKHMINNSSLLLIVGSSLQVFSAYRFVKLANELERPIVILNSGPTRADSFADLIIHGNVNNCLPLILERVRERLKIYK